MLPAHPHRSCAGSIKTFFITTNILRLGFGQHFKVVYIDCFYMDKRSSNLSVVWCSSNILHWESCVFIDYIQYFHKYSLSNNFLLCNFSITYVYTLRCFRYLFNLRLYNKYIQRVKFPTSKTGRLVLKKNLFFSVGEYTEYGFDQQRLIWYVFVYGVRCLAIPHTRKTYHINLC